MLALLAGARRGSRSELSDGPSFASSTFSSWQLASCFCLGEVRSCRGKVTGDIEGEGGGIGAHGFLTIRSGTARLSESLEDVRDRFMLS